MKPIHLSRGIRVASAVLLIILFAIGMQAQSQDSASPDLNEMKAKLQQLEQEMQSLKGQISAVQQSQPAPGAATSIPYPAAEKSAKGREENKSSIDLYGFIMLDSGYDFKTNNPDWFDVVRENVYADSTRRSEDPVRI